MAEYQEDKIYVDGWVIQVRQPKGKSPVPVMLLLHGLTGDENAMWIFTRQLANKYILLSPRGLYPSPLGGFSWHSHGHQEWPSVEDFEPAIEAIMSITKPGLLDRGNFSKLYLLGFSQGAALAYTFALKNPDKVASFAGLSGFLPEDADELIQEHSLTGISGFITHGTQDDLVPIEKARKSVRVLEMAGAEVTYCEKDVGHKLSSECFREMESYFISLLDTK